MESQSTLVTLLRMLPRLGLSLADLLRLVDVRHHPLDDLLCLAEHLHLEGTIKSLSNDGTQ